MRLRALRIRRLPGIGRGFALEELDPGLNVVLGPNASGKTSLIRALRAALYREELPGTGVDVEAEFEDAAGRLTAARLGTAPSWTRDGRETEAPPLPDHRFLRCYLLEMEDLLDGAETDQDIAERLARELAGGYDLRALRENPPFRLKSTHGKKEAADLLQAKEALGNAQRHHLDLQKQEATLGRLREEKEAAARAARKAESYELALDLLAARRARRGLEERTREFPSGMELLRGDEPDRLHSLRDMRDGAAAERKRDETALEEARRALEDTGLADEQLDEAAVTDRRHLLRRLQDVERDVNSLREEQERAAANRDAAVRNLGGGPESDVRLTPEEINRAEEQLEAKRGLEADLRVLERERERLPELPEGARPGEDPERDAVRMRTARAELQRWLAAAGSAQGSRARGAAAVLFLLALAGALVAGFAVHYAFLALVVPAAVAAYLLLRPNSGEARRREARDRFRETGLPEPEVWDEPTVRGALEDLDRRLLEAERLTADLSRRTEIDREQAARRRDLDAAAADLAHWARTLGFDPGKLDASFARWISLVGEYDRAAAAVEEAGTALADRLHEQSKLREEVCAFLRRYGEAPEVEDPDASMLSARLEELAGRVRRRDAARQNIQTAGIAVERAGRRLQQLQEEIRTVFTGAGLDEGDETGLSRRIEQLDEWKELQAELRKARWKEDELRRELAEQAELLARVEGEGEKEEVLRRELEEFREQAGLGNEKTKAEEKAEEITRIGTLVEQAQIERKLEQARADLQAEEDRLRDRRDEALYAEAGRYLLEQVEAEHVEATQPAALGRAEEWFRLFTRHQYELEFAPGEEGFTARETGSGEVRALSELSSGTRMQLILAVRIAFALEAEQGRASLPFFLDEALTTADPERFQAVVEALRVLAETGGRQVFYLTAQPQDVLHWGLPEGPGRYIDLAEVREWESAIAAPETLTLPPRRETPHPDAYPTAEEYAVALGVPPVDIWEDPGAVHLFHVLRDDLELLHRLLESGVERLGHLRSLLQSDACEYVVSEEEGRRLDRRAGSVQVWFEARREGRGRPVDRRALEESGAVSDTFMERVAELNRAVGGDARSLLKRLEAGEVDRFHSRKREQLEEYLQEKGFLGDGRVPAGPEVELRVQSALSDTTIASRKARDEARQLVNALTQGMRSAADRG